MKHLPTAQGAGMASKLALWFSHNARDLPWRRKPTPYRVWISEIMLQQTQVATVIPYFERFIARFPDVRSLAAATEHDVLALWSGLGYYRRARMLHAAAKEIVDRHAGEFPSGREAVLALPGIGRYTAGAILSIAFNRPQPIVDGNVARVYARVAREKRLIKSKRAQTAAWAWAEALVQSRRVQPRVLNQALMELGATVCTPQNPRCEVCPLARQCAARNHGDAAELPRTEKRPGLKSVRYNAWLGRDRRGRVLLVRRSQKLQSLLPIGLWELPVSGSSTRRPVAGASKPLRVVRQAIMSSNVELAIYEGRAPIHASCELGWFSERQWDALPMASITRKALASYSAASTR